MLPISNFVRSQILTKLHFWDRLWLWQMVESAENGEQDNHQSLTPFPGLPPSQHNNKNYVKQTNK